MPRVACLMPTYNKFPRSQVLVEEALHSFLIQDYQDKELLICNDCSEQTLQFTHPSVRVFNLSKRFPNLGAKLNWMVEQTDSEVIFRFDDDDISLPWRLTWCLRHMDATKADYLIPGQFWATNDEIPSKPKTSYTGGALAQAVYKRLVFWEVGGYPPKSFGEDASLEYRFRELGNHRVIKVRAPQHEASYLYRWGTNSDHLSGFGKNGKGWDRIGAKSVVPGEFLLVPHWQEDYVKRVNDKSLKMRGPCDVCGKRYITYAKGLFCDCT